MHPLPKAGALAQHTARPSPAEAGGRPTPHSRPAALQGGGRGVALLQSRAWRESRAAMAFHCTRRGPSPVAPASPEVARHMAALDGDGMEAGPSVLWRLLSARPVSLPSRLPGERHELTHAASVPPGERPGQGRPLSPRSGASEVGGRRASGVKAAHTPHRADRVPPAGPVSPISWPVSPGPVSVGAAAWSPRSATFVLSLLCVSQRQGCLRECGLGRVAQASAPGGSLHSP